MAKFKIVEKMTTYAEAEIEADSWDEANERYRHPEYRGDDLNWSYETDYDTTELVDITEVSNG